MPQNDMPQNDMPQNWPKHLEPMWSRRISMIGMLGVVLPLLGAARWYPTAAKKTVGGLIICPTLPAKGSPSKPQPRATNKLWAFCLGPLSPIVLGTIDLRTLVFIWRHFAFGCHSRARRHTRSAGACDHARVKKETLKKIEINKKCRLKRTYDRTVSNPLVIPGPGPKGPWASWPQ